MKKILIIFLLHTFTFFAQQQTIDVFSCYDYRSEISINECSNNEIDIQKNCMFIRGEELFEINPHSDKNFQAHDEIHITADFHDKSDDDHTHHYGSSNKANFEVAYMNAWWPNVFIKYDKLEIGNTLPLTVQEKVDAFFANFEVIQNTQSQYNPDPNNDALLNPFLEWDIKVETVFTHLASGFEKTIFGFYYEDFQRDYVNEEWDAVATPYIFRTRYAPPQNGKWKARTKITVGEGLEVYLSDPYFFEVVEGGQHGFVKVHENKRNLKLEDRMIMPVGHNLAWAGWDVGWAGNENVHENFNQWQDYHSYWSTYSQEGSRYARLHFHNKLADVEWEHVGNYKNRLNFAWEFDKLIDFFEEKDLLVHLTLMMQHQLSQIDETRFRWDFDGFFDGSAIQNTTVSSSNASGYWTQLGLRNVVDYISDPVAIKYLKQRMRYLISRYCYSTSIYLLDIHSEINNSIAHEDHHYTQLLNNTDNRYYNSIDTRLKVYDYHIVMSDYIKNTLSHKEHLLSVNYTDWPFRINDFGVNQLDPDDSYSLSNFDVISLNSYSASPNKLYIDEPNNILNQRSYTWNRYGVKPIIFGEVGSEDHGCWSDYREMNIADLMTIGFTGIAGFNTWYGITDSRVFQPVKRTSDHMNGDDVINTLSNENGEWILAGEKNENIFIQDNIYQHFYYKSENLEKVVGFVKNNTYNFFNYGSTNCQSLIDTKYQEIVIRDWQQNDFKIKGLVPNHNYRIHYYSFDNYLESDCFNANSLTGNQDLKHPISAKILWYVAYIENCMNGMALSDDNLTEQPTESITNKESKSEKKVELKSDVIDDYEIIPNPANETFLVRGGSNRNTTKFNLYDSQNKLVQEGLIINEYCDLSSYKSGLYYIKIESSSIIQFLKLVKL